MRSLDPGPLFPAERGGASRLPAAGLTQTAAHPIRRAFPRCALGRGTSRVARARVYRLFEYGPFCLQTPGSACTALSPFPASGLLHRAPARWRAALEPARMLRRLLSPYRDV